MLCIIQFIVHFLGNEMSEYVMTSEYVSPGHPDKIADQISDTVLDTYVAKDPHAKVACETMVKGNTVYVCGEISSSIPLQQQELEKSIRQTIIDIGYNHERLGFDGNTCNIHFDISEQSREIHAGVEKGGDAIGAGDQGIMFGFATRETPTNMPPAIYLSKQLIDIAYATVHQNENEILRPDMKSQVTLRYEDGKVRNIDTIVLSCCHSEEYTVKNIREYVFEDILPIVQQQLPDEIQSWFTDTTRYLINPAGAWHQGGPKSDCGLTGRKIVIDQYGADCEIGGGAFSGKDSTKVDKSAAYMARHIALATLKDHPDVEKVKVQLAYAIGEEYPVSCRIFNPDTKKEFALGRFSIQDLTPHGIQERLGLQYPIYLQTAKHGHFGNKSYTENGVRYYAWEEVS